MDVSAAVLVGGKGLRMGSKNKAFLELEGESFMERTISRLRPLFDRIIIIGDDVEGYSSFGLPVPADLRQGNEYLGGLLTALRHSPTPKTFCVACDMPFLAGAVVACLLDFAGEDWDVVIPRLPEGLEPLCAVYSTSLADRIESLLDAGERRIRRVLDGARTRYVDAADLRSLDPSLLSFMNVNTPDDLERARTLLVEKPS